MLKADRVVLTDGEIYTDVWVIPGDISICVVTDEETLDITRESVRMVTYTDPKAQYMIKTMAMGLLLDTFEEVQETLIDLEITAETVQSYIDELHDDSDTSVEQPKQTTNPYE